MAEATGQPSVGQRIMNGLSQFMVPKDKPLTTPAPAKAPDSVLPAAQPKLHPDGKPVLDANGNLVMQEPTNNPANNIKQDPLNLYKDLFSPRQADEKAPKAPTYTLSPDITNKAAQGMDFMAGLPEELATNLQEGKLDAATLSGIVNHVSRNAYARAMEHSSSLTDKFVSNRNAFDLEQALPVAVRNALAKQNIRSLPNMQDNPVAQKHYEFISSQFAEIYPDMTPQEIVEATTNYFTKMGDVASPRNGESSNQRGNPNGSLEFDYGAYLTNKAPT